MNVPILGERWFHKRKKTEYMIVRNVPVRNQNMFLPSDAKWLDGVLYQDKNQHYVRTLNDFMSNFERKEVEIEKPESRSENGETVQSSDTEN